VKISDLDGEISEKRELINKMMFNNVLIHFDLIINLIISDFVKTVADWRFRVWGRCLIYSGNIGLK
jgi:hypothetical protein